MQNTTHTSMGNAGRAIRRWVRDAVVAGTLLALGACAPCPPVPGTLPGSTGWPGPGLPGAAGAGTVLGLAAWRRRRERRAGSREAPPTREPRALAPPFQPRPDFLLGALDAIHGAIEADRPLAHRLIADLSTLLRHSLRGRPPRSVRLCEEIESLRGYVSVEAARRGVRIDLGIDLEPGAARCRIPALLLHPLMEDALGHGPAWPGEPVRVRLWVREVGDRLVATVESAGAPGGAWGGVEAVRRLLRQRFGDRSRVTLTRRGRRARVRLELPAHPSPADAPAVCPRG